MRKGKVRFTALITSIVMIFSLSVSNVYAYTNTVPDFCLEDNTDQLGKIIPSGVSDAAFSDKVDYDSLDELQYKRSISMSGDNVSVSLSLLINSSVVELDYDGKLYKSFRYTDEKPVYVGAFESDSTAVAQSQGQIVGQVDNPDIIYFEISNDISPYNLNQDLRGTSSITMYLRSEEGTIYDLGSTITAPVILDGIVDQAPSDNDINWFMKYFNGAYGEVTNQSARSAYNSVWAGDVHTLTYQVAGYEHMFLASPYIDFAYGDVPFSGIMEFSMALKISESHKYRLVGNGNWIQDTGDYTKCFLIDNVQLAWTAGGNTQIHKVSPHLRVANNGTGSFPFTGLAAAVTGLFKQTASLSQILSVANEIQNLIAVETTQFTNDQEGGALINTRAYKIQFPTDYYIDEYGSGLQSQRFEYIANMVTVDSNQQTSVWTYAVAGFTFKMSWADITGQSGSRVYTGYKELGYYNNFVI